MRSMARAARSVERIGGHSQVFVGGVFLLGVAQTGGRGREDHHGRASPGPSRWRRAAHPRQLHVVALHLTHLVRGCIEQARVERHRWDAEDVLELDGAAFRLGGDVRARPSTLAYIAASDSWLMWRMSIVTPRLPGVAVTTPGQQLALPTVVTPSWVVPISATASTNRDAAQERVATHLHRHRAGVRRLAGEDQPLALDALRAGDGADAEALRLEHRTLFDVHLEVGLHVGSSRVRAPSMVSRLIPCSPMHRPAGGCPPRR